MKTATGWKAKAFVVVLIAAAVAATPLAADADDAWITGLEGGWAGEDNQTPLGRMPFAFVFEREPDGSLHAHSALNTDTWLDLRFVRDETRGGWLLEESAALEGLGAQRHTLVPVDGEGGLRRWITLEDPAYLVVDVGVNDAILTMNVRLRGEDHAQFHLARVSEDRLADLKAGLTAQASRPAGPGTSIHERSTRDEVPEAIRRAREAVAAHPQDARAWMALADALGTSVRENPMVNGARYAAEWLDSLRTTSSLEPGWEAPLRQLAGYFLNAPPIAGGSLDEAEEIARKLMSLDPEAGRSIMEEIRRRRESGSTPSSESSQ